ncbi:MAG: hypothetical protein ACJ8FS_00610 [Sphingomicrobium sp.]
MRQLFLLAAALFVTGASDPEPLRYYLRFGTTPTSPIAAPVPCAAPTPGHELCPRLLPDYVPNYESVVPQAIRSCGASFVGFEAMTDGAERAKFDVAPGPNAGSVIACIKRRLPQGYIEGPANGRS